MRAVSRLLGSAAGISVLAACTGGQSGIQPPSQAVNVQATSTLQFRVGTANYQGTSTYLNTVVTFRQPSGLSATLYDTPAITGPAGFVVPAAAPNSPATASGAGTDAGTNRISATPPAQPGTTAVATTFGQVGGAFSYGFAPANSTTSGVSFYPGLSTAAGGRAFGNAFGATVTDVYTQPVYRSAAGRRPFVLGPPAVPDFHGGSFPAGFLGYDSGFTTFAATPVSGSYSLHVDVPSSTIGQSAAVFDVTASLASAVVLGTEAPPVVAEAGGAGTAVTFTVAPAPAGASQQVLYVVDVRADGTPVMYSFNAGAAGGVFTLPAASFAAGDLVGAYVVGADWDIVGGAAPNNASPAPSLPAQTDVTISPIAALTYM